MNTTEDSVSKASLSLAPGERTLAQRRIVSTINAFHDAIARSDVAEQRALRQTLDDLLDEFEFRSG